jgi:hypothetical protein
LSFSKRRPTVNEPNEQALAGLAKILVASKKAEVWIQELLKRVVALQQEGAGERFQSLLRELSAVRATPENAAAATLGQDDPTGCCHIWDGKEWVCYDTLRSKCTGMFDEGCICKVAK